MPSSPASGQRSEVDTIGVGLRLQTAEDRMAKSGKDKCFTAWACSAHLCRALGRTLMALQFGKPFSSLRAWLRSTRHRWGLETGGSEKGWERVQPPHVTHRRGNQGPARPLEKPLPIPGLTVSGHWGPGLQWVGSTSCSRGRRHSLPPRAGKASLREQVGSISHGDPWLRVPGTHRRALG